MRKPGLVARALALAALLSTGACLATTEDVREGVDRANEALLALDHARSVLEATDEIVPVATTTALVETRDAAVERALGSIDEALARVSPESRTADALWVRKGWLLLNAGRYASARSAFAEVTAPPVRERDRAILDLGDELAIWFRYAPAEGAELESFPVDALRDALTSFTRSVDDADYGGDIRHWLEIQRVLWIVKLVAHLYQDDGDEGVALLRDALGRYAAHFTQEERDFVARWARGVGPLEGARWYVAPAILLPRLEEQRLAVKDGAGLATLPAWPAEADWLLALFEAR